MSDSVWTHRRQPTRLPSPWDSPGKNTGVGCHFLLQCMKVKSEREVSQSCLTLSNPMDCSPPGSSVHGILQARVLEWGAIAFSTWNLYNVIYQCCLNKNKQSQKIQQQDNYPSSPSGMFFSTLLIESRWAPVLEPFWKAKSKTHQ